MSRVAMPVKVVPWLEPQSIYVGNIGDGMTIYTDSLSTVERALASHSRRARRQQARCCTRGRRGARPIERDI